MISLPPAARAKLTALEGQSADARDASSAAQRRLDDLRRELNYTDTPAENAGDIKSEMARLSEQRDKMNYRHGEIASLVANIHLWLRRLPPGTVLEQARTTPPKLADGETVVEALKRTRDTIAATKQHLATVRSAPLPLRDLKAAVAERVRQLAERGRPIVRADAGQFTVNFEDGRAYAFSSERVIEHLAWLDPAAVIAALEREVDQLPRPRAAMTAAEKSRRVAELTGDIAGYEASEEALIERANSDGLDLLRRASASPAAVLGVAIKQRKAAAA